MSVRLNWCGHLVPKHLCLSLAAMMLQVNSEAAAVQLLAPKKGAGNAVALNLQKIQGRSHVCVFAGQ